MKGGRDSIDNIIQIFEESNKEWEKNKDVEFSEFSKKKKGFRNDVKRVLVHESKKVYHEIITEDEGSGKKVKYSEFREAERSENKLKYAEFRKIQTEENEEDWVYTEVIVGDPAEEFEDAEFREIPLEGSGKVEEDAEFREIPLEGSGKVEEDAEFREIDLPLPERYSGKGKVSSNSSLIDLLINTLSVVEKEKETQNRDTRGKKDRYSYDKNRGRGGVQHRKDNNYNKYIYNKPYWQKKKKDGGMRQRIAEREEAFKILKKYAKKGIEKRGIQLQRNGKNKRNALFVHKVKKKKKVQKKFYQFFSRYVSKQSVKPSKKFFTRELLKKYSNFFFSKVKSKSKDKRKYALALLQQKIKLYYLHAIVQYIFQQKLKKRNFKNLPDFLQIEEITDVPILLEKLREKKKKKEEKKSKQEEQSKEEKKSKQEEQSKEEKKKKKIKRAHMYVIHTIRRKIHKYLKQLPYSDACFPVEGYINLYTLFNFFFEKHINISLRDVKSIFYRYWKEWLRVAARVTVVDMMKYVKAIALVRRMVEKFFYNKIVHANLVVKNTYMNTFLTLMYQGRRVIYQDTAGRWDISRRVRYKPFVGFVLARKLVGLLDWLRRTNRFNIINIDIRGLRIYTRSIYNKLRGYRRYLMKSLRYYNYLFIGQELKRARIIIKIFPKKFKWTNVQKQNYDHIKGQCFYFTSRYYHIGCMIRRTKKPFNGCRMLPVKMKRSNKGKGRKKKKK